MILDFGMRLYQKPSGIWYVSLPGNIRRSLKTRDNQAAQRLFRRLKKEAMLGNVITLEKQNKICLADFIISGQGDCLLQVAEELAFLLFYFLLTGTYNTLNINFNG